MAGGTEQRLDDPPGQGYCNVLEEVPVRCRAWCDGVPTSSSTTRAWVPCRHPAASQAPSRSPSLCTEDFLEDYHTQEGLFLFMDSCDFIFIWKIDTF